MKDKLQVEYISIDEIKPYKGNAKKHLDPENKKLLSDNPSPTAEKE